ncbi:hypothetical protein ACRAWF_17495 [Streptomyces sp. L7]
MHVCVRGRRLSAVLLGHRPREATECPHCARALPASLGTARPPASSHTDRFGGTSSGKTMLMAAMLAGITSWEREGRLTVTCALPEDRRRLQLLKSQVDSGGWVHGTPGRQPQAYMLEFTSGRSRRLLYLYDPHGGVFDNAATVRSQHYPRPRRRHRLRHGRARRTRGAPGHRRSRRTVRRRRPPLARGPTADVRPSGGRVRCGCPAGADAPPAPSSSPNGTHSTVSTPFHGPRDRSTSG